VTGDGREPRSPIVDRDAVTFSLADPRGAYRAVRLSSGLSNRAYESALRRVGTTWTLRLPRPAVDRLEYEFEVERPDGTAEHICDPGNPERVRGEFGDRSVVVIGAYTPPAWLEAEAPPGSRQAVAVRSRALRAEVHVDLWSPADTAPATPLPLLVAHDGPTYDRVSRLTRYAAAMIQARRLPPHRVALLSGGDRNEWYSASALYARAMAREVLPELRSAVAVRGAPVGVGASLGGLALLHAEHRVPGTFAGLFLQSSSFFAPRFDRHESGFPRYRRIVRFVTAVDRAPAPPGAPPVVLTCGREEENLENNRAMAAALRARGWDVAVHETRGLHDHVAWRDALDPHLTALLARVWPPL
jgi:enterochelin esterase family protein